MIRSSLPKLQEKPRQRVTINLPPEGKEIKQLVGSRSQKKRQKKDRTSTTDSNDRCRTDFFKTFRNVSRLDDQCAFYKTTIPPTVAYLKQIETERLNPIPFQLFASAPTKQVSARGIVTDRYARSYAAGLVSNKSLSKLSLKNSRLKSSSSSRIVGSLQTKFLKEVNLTGNKLCLSSINDLAAMLSGEKSLLSSLELENCGLTDLKVSVLCASLENNSNLVHMNLAKNSLKASSGFSIGNMLRFNQKLKVLDLHWNCVNQEGASCLFDGLEYNDFLRQIDLSWNALGTKSDLMLPALSKCLENNTELRHIDLSFNTLGADECESIGNSIKNNHTILGIHMLGNSGHIDPLGFVQITESSLSTGNFCRIFDRQKQRAGENCWLCEKWVETAIVLPNACNKKPPVYVHIDIDNYVPCLMKEFNKKFRLRRILPQSKLRLFFSDSEGNVFLSRTLTQKSAKTPIQVQTDTHCLKVYTVNILEPSGFECEVDYHFNVQPRDRPDPPPKPVVQEPIVKKEWSIKNSIFKDCVFETSDLLDKCFEHDWNQSKINTLFNSEDDMLRTKEVLRKWYPAIKSTYKSLSVVSFAETFSVSSNTFHDFINTAKVFDALYGQPDLGVNWSATLTNKSIKAAYNPPNSIVRFEFLEILIRIASDKYSGNGSLAEAVERLMKQLEEYLKPTNSEDWHQRYYCEEVESVLKANEYLLQIVYNLYSGKRSFPRHRDFMSMEEFRDLCADLKYGGPRMIDQIYVNSMFCQINELDKKQHMEMSLLEFYEALMKVLDLNLHNGTLAEKLVEAVPKLNRIISFIKKKTLRLSSTAGKQLISRRSTICV